MRRYFGFTLAVVIGLALAACGKGGGSTNSTSTSGSAASSTPAPATGTPIKIGLLEALTGPIANVGKDTSDGFKLYFSTVNNAVSGHPVQIIVADTTGQPDVAAAKVRDLVENQKVDIVAGINQTPECYAVAQYVQQAQVPLLV